MKISDLPKEYRELVEKNINKAGINSKTVEGAFVWDDTEEGHDFWFKVEQAETIEGLPKIVKI